MEDTISVLPRIIDPDMKFTVDSIKGIPNKKSLSSTNVKKLNDNNSTDNSDAVSDSGSTTCSNTEPSKIGIFWTNYKYIILTIVIIILLGIIVYLIYRYFKNNKTKNIENKSDDNKPDEKISDETKQKINEYVSNYIIDEEESSVSNEEELHELHELDNINNTDELDNIKGESTELLVETEQNIIHKSLPQEFNLVIQENIKVDPKLNIDSNRFEELYESVENNLELNEINNIDNKNIENINESNLDIELDKLIKNSKNNIDYEINSDKESETNESLDLNNIIEEIEPSEDNKSDDNIDYFKKFIKNSQ
jgi:predicted negative regulator of RcsB-dependent stress response